MIKKIGWSCSFSVVVIVWIFIWVFEKAEIKLIEKLRDIGLNHWDLWLELGDLYGKYGEKEKQKEIYTLILSKADGEEKKLATYRLIGMN